MLGKSAKSDQTRSVQQNAKTKAQCYRKVNLIFGFISDSAVSRARSPRTANVRGLGHDITSTDIRPLHKL